VKGPFGELQHSWKFNIKRIFKSWLNDAVNELIWLGAEASGELM
jgi:hypothetical protein